MFFNRNAFHTKLNNRKHIDHEQQDLHVYEYKYLNNTTVCVFTSFGISLNTPLFTYMYLQTCSHITCAHFL